MINKYLCFDPFSGNLKISDDFRKSFNLMISSNSDGYIENAILERMASGNDPPKPNKCFIRNGYKEIFRDEIDTTGIYCDCKFMAELWARAYNEAKDILGDDFESKLLNGDIQILVLEDIEFDNMMNIIIEQYVEKDEFKNENYDREMKAWEKGKQMKESYNNQKKLYNSIIESDEYMEYIRAKEKLLAKFYIDKLEIK